MVIEDERFEDTNSPPCNWRGGCADGADGVVIPDELSQLTTPAFDHPSFARRGNYNSLFRYFS